MYHTFYITPVSKPRMTRSDKWKTNPNHPDPRKRQREAVTKWFQYERDMQWIAKVEKYEIGECIDLIFYIPMPDSWSKKKRAEMNNKPHQQKPDTDNLIKAFCDALTNNDEVIFDKRGRKFWTDDKVGAVLVQNMPKFDLYIPVFPSPYERVRSR